MQDAGHKISAGKLLLSKNGAQIVSPKGKKIEGRIVRNIPPFFPLSCIYIVKGGRVDLKNWRLEKFRRIAAYESILNEHRV